VNRKLTLALILFAGGLSVMPSSSRADSTTLKLEITEGNHPQRIDVVVAIDGSPFDQYWSQTVDAIFRFADGNSDGLLSEQELQFVPAAKSVRQAQSSGFAAPVAPSPTLKDIASQDASKVSPEDLRNYYVRHRAMGPSVGHGRLSDTQALTQAVIRALDRNGDGRLAESEMRLAEAQLQPLDINDDGLIGVGELLPHATYPGNWATSSLGTTSPTDISRNQGRRLLLRTIGSGGDFVDEISAKPGTTLNIEVSDQLQLSPFQAPMKAHCETWAVLSTSASSQERLRESILSASPDPPTAEGTGGQRRNRKPSRAWLTPLVDRDRNGEASSEEIEQWLAIQKQLVHGQVRINIFHGGGLFELLDSNHDAALSARELRTAWSRLEAESCTDDQLVDVTRIPEVVFLVVSQGTLPSITKPTASSPTWFHQMDRNADGDVSRREFTGPPDAFVKLDNDQDGLLSAEEAKSKP